ncbi:DNA polymerase zeta, catalytic subunit [Aspergillus steynii IBT 23096]|uniref:DNA polymerase n=1 Tax=Aspergillus steynii IBT 23096 TaxID=1392250 RepID=A0A2I2GHQ9_9EURO|nr:DNA polymerase zeta, catalytic subunit [Aspergillus steynii IBT 23096]PLB52421.1 DNA polymerase zeta, catalytic subunit [Aspergillus steynii IBT 23096]
MEPFQVRLNCLDHYQAVPSEFDPPFTFKDGSAKDNFRPKVPVIRIFGVTETNQKVCVHVHGAIPYLYVEYEGSLEPEQVALATRNLHVSIDHALAASYQRNAKDKKAVFVAHITLVKGIPFYGYHVGYRFFFKIYLLSPIYITRLADLLLQGAVLKRPLQPYESHLQYIPQWMCDYSLYGCAYMKCSKVKFRSPVPDYLELTTQSHRWHDRSIQPDCISEESALPKQSNCALEVDVRVQDILNRLEINERPIHHDFTELLKPMTSDERLVPSMAGLWQDETRRRKRRLGIVDPGSSPFTAEDLTSLSAETRSHLNGPWIHEEEYREMASEIAAAEKRQMGTDDITFDNVLVKKPFEENIKTVLESVGDFFADQIELSSAHGPQDPDIGVQYGTILQDNVVESDDDSYCSDDNDIVDLFSEEEDGAEEIDVAHDPFGNIIHDGPFPFEESIQNNQFLTPKKDGPLGTLGNSSTRIEDINSRENINAGIQSATRSLKQTNSHSLDTHMSELASSIYETFNIPPSSRIRCLRLPCPNPSDILSSLNEYGYPSVIYKKAHYGNVADVPDRPRDYAGREFRLEGSDIHYLPDFDPSGRSFAMMGEQPPVVKDRNAQEEVDRLLRESSTSRVWEFAPVPPSRAEVISWFEKEQSEIKAKHTESKESNLDMKPNVLSQIEGPTQKNEYGFKYSQKEKSTSVEQQNQYMSIMSLEVHVNTRGVLSPNPEEDEISSIVWCVQSDDEDLDVNSHIPGVHVGMVVQSEVERPDIKISKAVKIDLEHEPSELDLITRLVDIVRWYDPDIITGYEVHNGSWGYVIERARKKYELDICDELSRVKSQAHGRYGKDADRYGFNHTSSIRITGRHMINIWRAMRSELNLLQYSMENVVFHLLHRRIPHYSFRELTAWYQNGKPRNIMKVVDYLVSRVQMNIEILGSNELIPRISEQARLLGIDFYSVISRGSQFKVESLMFRIAKPENFLLVSPSRKQIGQQNALECLPLVMEPQSDFYTSPLIVLDFQSLYPSIMIAYNYCYSTFLGRARQWRTRDKMGFMDYQRQSGLLELLKDKINIAPNGMIYAKSEVRKSLLAKMLAEILETRVMVKTGMKMDKDDKTLQRLLNNRQLALKLIANVTYGYTSASFSGRMPCSEIADSIVQSGRETLEKAIAFIHSVERWGAEVVYGDTDSLFVYLRGRTRDQAFDIGEEIAKAVTEINPHPVKLKFEKVYHPCVLLAKKRYVGFKYEHRDQKEPEFDAKGIETVRRDGTPAEQKIEEKALKLLFRTADLSLVKSYFQKQCTKILQGRVSIQDFCFAREVKLGTYSERGLPPPGALISTKKMLEDPRSEPQYGERVPYVVVTGAPGSRLIDRCVPPETLLHDPQLDLDAEYYITKNLIPPLERIFNLVGANVRSWYDEMPRFQRIRRVEGSAVASGSGKDARKTLESYMKSSTCIVCRAKLQDAEVPVCPDCMRQSHVSLLDLVNRQREAEKRVLDLHRVCRSCMGVAFDDDVKCDSKDCPVFYSRTRHMANWRHTKAVLDPVVKLLQDTSESALEW